MTSFVIKIIALVTMVIDHIGCEFLPNIYILRFIGRISFPLYCFLLVKGYTYTKDVKKYILRIGILACLSEVIYDLTFYDKFIYLGNQNVLFELMFGLIMLCLYEKLEEKNNMGIISIILFGTITYLLNIDYNFIGMAYIYIIYLAEKLKKEKADVKNINLKICIFEFISFFILTFVQLKQRYLANFSLGIIINGEWRYFGVLIAIFVMWLYNDKQGANNKFVKYAFYLFYPAHLAIMCIFKYLI